MTDSNQRHLYYWLLDWNIHMHNMTFIGLIKRVYLYLILPLIRTEVYTHNTTQLCKIQVETLNRYDRVTKRLRGVQTVSEQPS